MKGPEYSSDRHPYSHSSWIVENMEGVVAIQARVTTIGRGQSLPQLKYGPLSLNVHGMLLTSLISAS